jgi:flagellin-like protein
MPKKAISPLVAIVILIAIVITLGGVISAWLNNLVADTSQQDTCAITTMYSLSDVSYNATNGEIKVKVKNTGKDDLHNFTVEADNGTLIIPIPANSPAETYKLGPGKSQYVLANSSEYNITNVNSIKVLVGSCLGYSSSAVNI